MKDFLQGHVVSGQEGMASGWREGRFRLEILCKNDGETLEWDVKRNFEFPIPHSSQGQIRWGFEQTDLIADVPAHCRRVGIK